MSLASIAPEFSVAFAKLHAKRPIKAILMMVAANYEDGTEDTIELTMEGMAAILAQAAKPVEAVKVVPMQGTPTPKAEAEKPKPKAKPEGTPKPKTEKPKSDYKPPLLVGLCKAVGVAEYLTNGGKWIDVAIMEDTAQPVVAKVREGMMDISFSWAVKDTKARLRNRRFIKAGECQCDKCKGAKAKAA